MVANRLQGRQSRVREEEEKEEEEEEEKEEEGFEGRRSLSTLATGSLTAVLLMRRGRSRRMRTAFNHHQYNHKHNKYLLLHDKDVWDVGTLRQTITECML